jgi:hypothetical protein
LFSRKDAVMADIPAGMTVTVVADIVVNGVLAFGRGEQVAVQQVSPDPQRPEYRYNVMSARTGTWYLLRDADIVVPSAALPQQQPQQPVQQSVEVVQPQYAERRRRPMPYPAAPIVGVLAGASGIVMVISTFLVWISASGITGWRMMSSSGFGTTHNFLFSTGASKIIFTGFWSLLFGIIVVAGAVTLVTGWGGANGLVLAGGILGLGISVVSIVMIYTVKPIALAPGVGLWLFAVFSLIAAVAGGVGASQAGRAVEA